MIGTKNALYRVMRAYHVSEQNSTVERPIAREAIKMPFVAQLADITLQCRSEHVLVLSDDIDLEYETMALNTAAPTSRKLKACMRGRKACSILT